MHLGKRCSARNSGTYCQPAANCGFNGKESGRAGTSSRPAGLFSQFKFNDLFVEHHIFLFYDHILVVVSEKPVFEPAPLAYLIKELC